VWTSIEDRREEKGWRMTKGGILMSNLPAAEIVMPLRESCGVRGLRMATQTLFPESDP
jgi:hypothetical protein